MEEFAAGDGLVGGEEGFVLEKLGLLGANHLDSALVGGAVIDFFEVHQRDVGAAEEVDKLHGVVVVFRALGHAQAVNPDVGAFLGDDVGEIVAVAHGIGGVAGPHQAHRRFAGDHLVLGFIHLVRLDDTGLFLLDELLLGQVERVLVAGVHRIAEHFQRHAQRIADGVHHEHVVVILLVPHRRPAGDRRGNHGLVIEDADGAPHIRHGIFAGGIIIGGLEPVERILGSVGQLRIVELLEQILGDQPFDNIIRGEDHVVALRVVFDLHEHILVGGKPHIVHLDAGFRFKKVNRIFTDVILPVEDVDLFGGERRKGGQQHRQGKRESKNFFHRQGILLYFLLPKRDANVTFRLYCSDR